MIHEVSKSFCQKDNTLLQTVIARRLTKECYAHKIK